MLTVNGSGTAAVSIIGIDPGSHNLGVGQLLVEVPTWRIISSTALTLVGVRLVRNGFTWMNNVHGERTTRIQAMKEELVRIFQFYQPVEIASESPFINKRFIQAGLTLTEVIVAVREAVMEYNCWMPLNLVDPPSVKNAVGASGGADKDVMKHRVMSLPDLNYQGHTPLAHLDEHSIDALAVAYHRYNNIRTSLCLPPLI